MRWKAESGYYRFLLPVPNSNRKNWSRQLRHLITIDAACQTAPVCIAATALLVHLTETSNDLLKNDWCRCAEALPDEFRVVLHVHKGCVSVGSDGDDRPNDGVWLSAAQKV